MSEYRERRGRLIIRSKQFEACGWEFITFETFRDSVWMFGRFISEGRWNVCSTHSTFSLFEFLKSLYLSFREYFMFISTGERVEIEWKGEIFLCNILSCLLHHRNTTRKDFNFSMKLPESFGPFIACNMWRSTGSPFTCSHLIYESNFCANIN